MRTYITSFLVVLFAFITSPAYAAMISLSPTTVSVTKGQTFTVSVAVNPAGTNVYTVKSSVSYPAALVQETSFAFDTGWMPLSMSGYDSVDNTNGTLIKTAGFPSGFNSAKTFGTITFTAKDTGTATISVGSASLAYDAQSKNTLSGTQGSAAVTVASTASAPAPTPTPPAPTQSTQKPTTSAPAKTTIKPTAQAASAAAITTTTATSASEIATTSESEGQTAAAATGSLSAWILWAVLAIVILGTIGFFIVRRR